MTYARFSCGQRHDNLPDVAFEQPSCARQVPPRERPRRIHLDSDLCMDDELERTNRHHCILLLLLLPLLIVSCSPNLPPLRVDAEETVVEVHFETLGEYPTSVFKAELYDDESNRKLWSIRTSQGTPQLWGLTFVTGENAPQPESVSGGAYEVLVPQEGSFWLVPRRAYRLEIQASVNHPPRVTTFSLAGR